MFSPNGDFGSSMGGGFGRSNDLGNLEDELAGAWEEGEEEDDMDQNGRSRTQSLTNGADVAQAPLGEPLSVLHDEDLAEDSVERLRLAIPNGHSAPTKKQRRRMDTDSTENMYNGSDYGEVDSPAGVVDLPPELRMLMHDVEELARQGSHMFTSSSSSTLRSAGDSASPTKQRNSSSISRPSSLALAPDAFGSNHARLRDLGGQTTLETLTSRLITAHTAITSHLTHQTRALQSAAFPLLSPLSISNGSGPSADDVDELLFLVAETLESLPQPSFTSLNSISHLHATGKEAVGALAGLSDSLHMSRQVESSAARRLKSARECAGEMRREYELEEVGRKWLEVGNWEQKLRGREAKQICNEVTGGFEEVCEGWRRRLVDAAAAQGVAEVSA